MTSGRAVTADPPLVSDAIRSSKLTNTARSLGLKVGEKSIFSVPSGCSLTLRSTGAEYAVTAEHMFRDRSQLYAPSVDRRDAQDMDPRGTPSVPLIGWTSTSLVVNVVAAASKWRY